MSLRLTPLHSSDGAFLGNLVADGGFGTVESFDDGRGIRVTGSTRILLSSASLDPASNRTNWEHVRFQKLQLLGKRLAFRVDLSAVGCGCNAAVSLVGMPERPPHAESSGYCDIQGYSIPKLDPCVTFDVIEGNSKAVQSTLHTGPGFGRTGRCNQEGCGGNWGRSPSSAAVFGRSGELSSREPFAVEATFPPAEATGALFDVRLSQGSSFSRLLLDSTTMGMCLHGGFMVAVSVNPWWCCRAFTEPSRRVHGRVHTHSPLVARFPAEPPTG